MRPRPGRLRARGARAGRGRRRARPPADLRALRRRARPPSRPAGAARARGRARRRRRAPAAGRRGARCSTPSRASAAAPRRAAAARRARAAAARARFAPALAAVALAAVVIAFALGATSRRLAGYDVRSSRSAPRRRARRAEFESIPGGTSASVGASPAERSDHGLRGPCDGARLSASAGTFRADAARPRLRRPQHRGARGEYDAIRVVRSDGGNDRGARRDLS